MSHYDPYKRRLRIVGTPDGVGYKTTIHDLDTGEELTNVATAVIYLNPMKLNEAELTYHEVDQQGNFVVVEGDVVVKKLRVDRPEIDLTVYEK